MAKYQRSEESQLARKLYKRQQWIKGRAHFLRHNPLCVFCLENGFAEPAKVVDHKIPHKGDEKLFFDQSNWQPLCDFHHSSIKQMMEKNNSPRIGQDGWPIED